MMIRYLSCLILSFLTLLSPLSASAKEPLRLGVGLFQPDKEKNDATYQPLAAYLANKLGLSLIHI
jgi:phosphonate transport system substrate-binding protein